MGAMRLHSDRKIIFDLVTHDNFRSVYELKCGRFNRKDVALMSPCCLVQLDVNCLQWKLFQYWVQSSDCFCRLVFLCFGNLDAAVRIYVHQVPVHEKISWLSSSMFQSLVYEKLICDTAMSYLSTLGGAFSALGDNFDQCAKEAGRISLTQLKIAFRLQDEPLVARCRIYLALSFIQQNKLKLAREIIEKQFEISKKYNDQRLANACLGVWSKLKYTWGQKRSEGREKSQNRVIFKHSG